MRGTILIATLLLAACAPLTQQQLEEREYRNVDWENRYLSYNQRCLAAGGRMVIQSSSSHRLRQRNVPRRGDYYSCTSPVRQAPRE